MTRKLFLAGLCWLAMVMGAEAQSRPKKMNDKNNPLICDPDKGICEIPGADAQAAGTHQQTPVEQSIRLIYFTDPICSACWSIEPQLRRLLMEYGNYIKLEYHMGGLLPSWEVYNAGGISKPSDVAYHWEEMSRHFEMPIDGDVWLKDPLDSSYPACIAFKAAELQGAVKASNFLRRIREMVFLEKKNISKWDNLKQAAMECGIDTAKLAEDYKGSAQQLFRDDLALAGRLGVRGFPALYFRDSLDNQTTIYGFRPYADFEQALLKLHPSAKKNTFQTGNGHLFMHFSSLTTKEYSVLSGINSKEAEVTLAELENKGRIKKYQRKNGPLWRRNSVSR